jgi:hypothetical protein
MQKSMLLDEIVAHVQLDVDLARLDARETGTNRRHEPLSIEARANARLELGILRNVRCRRFHAARRHATQIGSAPKSTSSLRSQEPCRCCTQRIFRQRTHAPPEMMSNRRPQTSHSVAISVCLNTRTRRLMRRLGERSRSGSLAARLRAHLRYGPGDNGRATTLAWR